MSAHATGRRLSRSSRVFAVVCVCVVIFSASFDPEEDLCVRVRKLLYADHSSDQSY